MSKFKIGQIWECFPISPSLVHAQCWTLCAQFHFRLDTFYFEVVFIVLFEIVFILWVKLSSFFGCSRLLFYAKLSSFFGWSCLLFWVKSSSFLWVRSSFFFGLGRLHFLKILGCQYPTFKIWAKSVHRKWRYLLCTLPFFCACTCTLTSSYRTWPNQIWG